MRNTTSNIMYWWTAQIIACLLFYGFFTLISFLSSVFAMNFILFCIGYFTFSTINFIIKYNKKFFNWE